MARNEEHFTYERYVLKAVTDVNEELKDVDMDCEDEAKRKSELLKKAQETE